MGLGLTATQASFSFQCLLVRFYNDCTFTTPSAILYLALSAFFGSFILFCFSFINALWCSQKRSQIITLWSCWILSLHLSAVGRKVRGSVHGEIGHLSPWWFGFFKAALCSLGLGFHFFPIPLLFLSSFLWPVSHPFYLWSKTLANVPSLKKSWKLWRTTWNHWRLRLRR